MPFDWREQEAYDTALSVYKTMPAIMLVSVLWINAPYGRFRKFSSALTLNGPWSWCLMETVSPIVFMVSFLSVHTGKEWPTSQKLWVAMWLIHYLHRSIIYSCRAPSIAPIHLSVSLSAAAYNVLNGFTNGVWVGRHSVDVDGWRWCGVCLWCIGFILNIYHDNLLFQQRHNAADTKSKDRYIVPMGGLYSYVSCPNYLTETVEWVGFLLAAWPSPPALLFVLSTVANLFPRALRTHEWYQHRFTNYPLDRKAVIPFIF
ncbi:3-oxo-5-alpha-steroid 4-dehydrogenase-domain-containing protein [Spinellus fusiger]|nr:3-oxo-5-alpha-steroid 4-dehydrogenase-domain-containing protein [Spinellus fusiger]